MQHLVAAAGMHRCAGDPQPELSALMALIFAPTLAAGFLPSVVFTPFPFTPFKLTPHVAGLLFAALVLLCILRRLAALPGLAATFCRRRGR